MGRVAVYRGSTAEFPSLWDTWLYTEVHPQSYPLYGTRGCIQRFTRRVPLSMGHVAVYRGSPAELPSLWDMWLYTESLLMTQPGKCRIKDLVCQLTHHS